MKLFSKISSLILTVLFLVSTLGLTLNKMVCQKSGKTKLSLTAIKNCCKEQNSNCFVIKKKCCTITNNTFNLGDFQITQKLKVERSLGFLAPSVRSNMIVKAVILTQTKIYILEKPPALYGRQLLFFISTLTI